MKKHILRENFGLIIGLLLLFFGGSLLLWTVAKIPYALTLFPILMLCLGTCGFFLYYTYNSDISLFIGMFLVFGALFFFIKHKFPEIYIKSYWPIFPLAIGLSLLLFSLRKNRKRRIAFLVPAITLIFLAILFLPFSLGIAKMSFLTFIRIWWPIGFLILGIVLLISHFRRRKKRISN